jgi:hypothetical protein
MFFEPTADQWEMPPRDGSHPHRLSIGGERDELPHHCRSPRAARRLTHRMHNILD